jgi:NAD(P)-dependent dehydrogenase (short-subunit alcohol dehydrogenase family)
LERTHSTFFFGTFKIAREEDDMADAKAALVVGAGDATGGAIARRFAREGYVACVTRRHADKLQPLVQRIEGEGGRARAFGTDARKEDETIAMVETIEREVGPIEVAVFNIGANVNFPIRDTTSRVYFKVWEMACFAGFLMGREAAKAMVPRGRGTILFTGATASVRGRSGYAAFAGAKHALRGLAQSMARELGPQGIHVAHVVIDGGIRSARRPEPADRPDSMLDPDAIAATYLHLLQQPRSAWSWEVEVRPWTESF